MIFSFEVGSRGCPRGASPLASGWRCVSLLYVEEPDRKRADHRQGCRRTTQETHRQNAGSLAPSGDRSCQAEFRECFLSLIEPCLKPIERRCASHHGSQIAKLK